MTNEQKPAGDALRERAELLPCPFCGEPGEVNFADEEAANSEGASCTNDYCGLAGWAMSLENWNTRTAAAETAALRAEIEDWQSLFDMQWEADKRAVELWRNEKPGRELTLPDRTNHVVWLLLKWEEANDKLAFADKLFQEQTAENDRLKGAMDLIAKTPSGKFLVEAAMIKSVMAQSDAALEADAEGGTRE